MQCVKCHKWKPGMMPTLWAPFAVCHECFEQYRNKRPKPWRHAVDIMLNPNVVPNKEQNKEEEKS